MPGSGMNLSQPREEKATGNKFAFKYSLWAEIKGRNKGPSCIIRSFSTADGSARKAKLRVNGTTVMFKIGFSADVSAMPSSKTVPKKVTHTKMSYGRL